MFGHFFHSKLGLVLLGAVSVPVARTVIPGIGAVLRPMVREIVKEGVKLEKEVKAAAAEAEAQGATTAGSTADC